MLTRSRRNDEDHENPAWPALVDLFALGMVLILVLWSTPSAKPSTPTTTSSDALVEKRLHELEQALRDRLSDHVERVEYRQDPQRVEVTTRVRFATNEYALTDAQKVDVERVIDVLAQTLQENNDALLVISGRADPRPMNRPAPPRDNVELSALRATEVSRLVADRLSTEPLLRARVTVSGLGETGVAPTSMADTPELQRLRTVAFQVQVKASVTNGSER